MRNPAIAHSNTDFRGKGVLAGLAIAGSNIDFWGEGGTTPQFFGVELDFDDKIEFCLRKTRFLVMELPRHRGTGLVELQVFISQYPYRSTFFYTYGQNLGCFEMVDLKILKAFDLISLAISHCHDASGHI